MRAARVLVASAALVSFACVPRASEEMSASKSQARPPAEAPVVLTDEALRIHRAGLLIDGHNDLPYRLREMDDLSLEKVDIARHQPELHTDLPRLRRGGVGAQFWSAYVPPETANRGGAVRYCLEQMDLIHRLVRTYPEDLQMACTAEDILRIHGQGRIASLIGIEGGHAIEGSLAALRMFHLLGARYMTLTHSETHDWADSATDKPRHGGLSPFGEEVVREMNRVGMLVDISHVSVETMKDALRVSRAPVIASHSSCFALAPHLRNVPDDVLRLMAANGGVVMVNFYPGFIDAEAARITRDLFDVARELRADHTDEAEFRKAMELWRREHPIPSGTVRTLVDHIDHVVRVAGIDHVGLGSDFDGVSQLPAQLEDVSCYPYITQELLNRGYSEGDIHRIMGGNLLRVLKKAEQVAREWQD